MDGPRRSAHGRVPRKIAAEARAHAGERLRTPAVQELARLFDDHAVLRMTLVRAIDEAVESGRRLGYTSIDELMTVPGSPDDLHAAVQRREPDRVPDQCLSRLADVHAVGPCTVRDAAVNAHLQNVLNVWCGFLGGPHSRAHLDTSAPDGWFCDAASKRIGLSQFQYRDDQPHGGFTSWNDFFTRRFRDGARRSWRPTIRM